MMTQMGFYNRNPFELSLSAIKHALEPEGVSYTKRVPNCQKCGQHGRKSRLKGHKRVCPYKDCNCPKCQVVSERQKLMADQIKIRRRQRKDTILNLSRETMTATLNAAAAFSAAAAANGNQMPFSLDSIPAILLNQFKSQGLNGGGQRASEAASPSIHSEGERSPEASSNGAPTALYPFSMDLLKPSFLFPPTPTLTSTSIVPSTVESTVSPSSPSSSSTNTLSSALESVLAANRSLPVGAGSPAASSTTPSPSLSLHAAPTTPTSALIAPVPINPSLSAPPLSFPFLNLPSNEAILQAILQNYPALFEPAKVMEESSTSSREMEMDEPSAPATPNAIIDVCTV